MNKITPSDFYIEDILEIRVVMARRNSRDIIQTSHLFCIGKRRRARYILVDYLLFILILTSL
jgi:hypothetical protein